MRDHDIGVALVTGVAAQATPLTNSWITFVTGIGGGVVRSHGPTADRGSVEGVGPILPGSERRAVAT